MIILQTGQNYFAREYIREKMRRKGKKLRQRGEWSIVNSEFLNSLVADRNFRLEEPPFTIDNSPFTTSFLSPGQLHQSFLVGFAYR